MKLPSHEDKNSPDGSSSFLPWECDVTVVIPHKNTPDWLELCADLWLRQRARIFLLVVDTASGEESAPVLDALAQREGVEVARLGVTRLQHPADGITAAMDYAFSRCPTDYLLATHTDLLPRHRHLVSLLLSLCGPTQPVVGWEMSPRGEGEEGLRAGTVSDGYPGHVCTMYHMPTMDRIGAGWALRRAAHAFGHRRTRHPTIAGWPDTETCLGEILRTSGIRPLFLGRETNLENQWTDHWLHARSRTAIGCEARHEEAYAWGVRLREQWDREATLPEAFDEGREFLQ